MKKLLLGMLAISSLSFAGVQNATNSAQEADVTVKARVVENLTMTADGGVVDFGILLKGQNDVSEVTAGQITIKGEQDLPIIITVKSSNESAYKGMNEVGKAGLKVDLKKDGTDAVNKLSTNLKFNHKGQPIETETIKITEANYVININGTATTTEDQVAGSYSETIKVKAQYQ